MKYTNIFLQPSSSQMALKVILQQAGISVVVLWLFFFSAVTMKHHLRSSNFMGFANLCHTSLQLPVKISQILDAIFFKSSKAKNILKMAFSN